MKQSNYDYYSVPKINNLHELVQQRKDSPRTAFMWRENGEIQRRSFQDIYQDVTRLSGSFYEKYRGVNIAVIGENSYAWIVYSLAIVLSGNVCVAIDKDGDLKTIKKQLKQCDVKALCYSDTYNPEAQNLIKNNYSFSDLKSNIRQGAKLKNQYRVDENKPAMIFFTSGTTGYSKAVVLSERNIAADIYGAASIFKPSGGASSFLPYHHAFGYVTSALKPYYYGVLTFISSSFKHLTDDFQTSHPNTIFAVPMVVETFYKQIWREARRSKTDKKLQRGLKISNMLLKVGIDQRYNFFKDIHRQFGGKLRYIICGGAPLDPSYVKWFRQIGIEVLNGYGITECSPVVAVNRNQYHQDGSVGQICRDVDVRIIDGEIAVGGDIVMLGYYKDKRATEAVLRNNYYFTGDLGYIDANGFLYVTGRKKNLIILSNGENVSPEEIEKELAKNPAISEVAVYEYQNRIIASIYPAEGYLGDQEFYDDIIYEYNQTKAKNRQIAMVHLRSKPFPRNNNGKVVRDKLIEEDNHERKNH